MKHRFGLLALLLVVGLAGPVQGQEVAPAGDTAAPSTVDESAPQDEAAAEAAPADSAPSDGSSAEAAPAEAAPAEAAPAEAAPADAAAAEAAPAEAAPAEAAPADTAPADAAATDSAAETPPDAATMDASSSEAAPADAGAETPADAASMDASSSEAPADAAATEVAPADSAGAEAAYTDTASSDSAPADEGASEDSGAEEPAGPPPMRKGTWFVSPMFSYALADDDRGTDDYFGGSITLGRRVTDGMSLGIIGMYSQLDPESGGGGSATLEGVGLSAQISWLNRWPRLYTPISIMYGAAEDHPGPIPDYKTTIVDLGLGYLWPLGQRMQLRTEALYRIDAHGRDFAGTTPDRNQEFYDTVFSVGLVIPLGREAQAAPEPTAVVEPVCPPAPEGTAVDERGCMLDADGDGVADNLDQCPDTPAGTQVNDKGCPIDSDGDGVPDEVDECPNSPAGAKVLANGCALTGDCRKPRPGEQVDENGCAAEKKFILKGVKFEFDSDRLTEEAKAILVDVAGTLQGYPDIKVELQGHTDNIGTDAYNLGLSERRANSVKTFLSGQNIDAGRMTPAGYGEAQPIDTNDTEEGRENNRRVELKVLE